MPSRRAFLKKAAVTAAAISAGVLATAQAAEATRTGSAGATAPTPKKKPLVPVSGVKPAASPAPGPSKLARELAASLQRALPKSHLSDSLTEKIASDINDNFAISKAFRNRKIRALPPPDFLFTAAESDEA